MGYPGINPSRLSPAGLAASFGLDPAVLHLALILLRAADSPRPEEQQAEAVTHKASQGWCAEAARVTNFRLLFAKANHAPHAALQGRVSALRVDTRGEKN